jgi:hypothetical protein
MSRWPASYSETPRFDRRAPGPRPLLPLGHCGVRDSQAPPALRRSTTGRGNQDRVRLPPQAARTAGPPRTQPRRYGRVMDDADGALRGLLARPGPDLLRALRDHWRLGQLADEVDLGRSRATWTMTRSWTPGSAYRSGWRCWPTPTTCCATCRSASRGAGRGSPTTWTPPTSPRAFAGEPSGSGAGGRRLLSAARLRRLVASYDAALETPLSAAERAALPVAMARQPLSSIGGWVARLDDEAAARRHAASVAAELQTAWRIMAELGRWREVFA